MILEQYKPGSNYMGQKMLMKVEWFGKEYYLMEDGDGTIYGVKVGEDGNPDLT